MTNPLISVIIPSYNHEKFIRQAIMGVLNQTYKNIELIVIDDGSTDNSRKIIRELNTLYKFQYYEQKNLGLSATLNKAIKEYIRGDFFSICASDDYYLPEKIETQYLFLKDNPDFLFCYAKALCVDENNQILKRQTKSLNRGLKGGNIFSELFLIKFHPPVTFLFNTEKFIEMGGYREDLRVEDYYMNLKIASRGPIGFQNIYLHNYRSHCNNSIHNNTRKLLDDQKSIIDEYRDHPQYDTAIKLWRLRKAYFLCEYKKTKLEALIDLIYSIRYLFTRTFISGAIRIIMIWK